MPSPSATKTFIMRQCLNGIKGAAATRIMGVRFALGALEILVDEV